MAAADVPSLEAAVQALVDTIAITGDSDTCAAAGRTSVLGGTTYQQSALSASPHQRPAGCAWPQCSVSLLGQ
jgi:hypothetical protein